jgi:hypothetical protein
MHVSSLQVFSLPSTLFLGWNFMYYRLYEAATVEDNLTRDSPMNFKILVSKPFLSLLYAMSNSRKLVFVAVRVLAA